MSILSREFFFLKNIKIWMRPNGYKKILSFIKQKK